MLIMKDESIGIRKEATVVYLEILCCNLSGETQQNHDKLQ